MGQDYHAGSRALQDQFDSRRLADRLDEATSTTISDEHRAFIEARDMFFIATADETGAPQCSYKGGDPGFVRVLDESTIAFPNYDGNGMFLTAGNMRVNPHVGLLFIDFEGGSRLRLNGTARILAATDPSAPHWPGAQLVVCVEAHQIFANCRRYVHHYRLEQRSTFVPSTTSEAPVPDWKRDPWFAGTLPEHDPAHDPDRPSAPAIPQF